jgi:hypothetical protein
MDMIYMIKQDEDFSSTPLRAFGAVLLLGAIYRLHAEGTPQPLSASQEHANREIGVPREMQSILRSE